MKAYKNNVGDYVSLQRGLTYKGSLVGEPGPALLGLGSIVPGGGFRHDYKTYGGECPSALMLKPGDLFVSLKGATKDGEMIGSVARVPLTVPTGRLTQDTVGLRFHDGDRETVSFLYWVLRTPQYRDYCRGRATGSAVVALSRSDFLSYPVPELTDGRRRLVQLFDAIEDKIELNRRRNRTLEAMARAIFQSWFVDFDPVKAKAADRTPPGLSPALAALFPDRFEDSPLGPIPAGWRVGCILEIADLLSGGTPKTSEPSYWDGDIPWASAKDVSQCGEAFLIDTERTITPQGLENSATQMIPAFSSVVVARGATTGRMTMFGHDIAMNQTCYALKSKFDAPRYMYLLLRHEIDAIVHTAHGSVFDTITTATFRSAKVCIAGQDLVQDFEKRVSPIFVQILNTLRQSRTLAALRDALLPKLISGELRVPDAERIVGRVV